MDKVHNSFLDKIGIGASLACAIHCILLPLLFSTLPLFGIEMMKNWKIEVSMVIVSFVSGSWALYHGYRKHHHHLWPLLAFGFGLSLVIAGNFIDRQWIEMTLKFFGAGAIITAHIFNLKYNKQCKVHPVKKDKEKIMYNNLKRMS
ncbi:MerC domain-containing protein [Parafilimonas sp.]|uniref:MerC domain-containing protein n=1 Tax=Parafilimonas sp. TaxID=1969739 RepID=UPI0039E50115